MALIAAAVALGMGGCGGGSDKARKSDTTGTRKQDPRNDALARDAELRNDAQQFVPRDLNQNMKEAGLRFRIRSATCEAAVEQGKGRCTLVGNDGRGYSVKLTIDPKDGSYEYVCGDCP